jgi:uncharacterized protein with NRDE domain
MCLIFFALNQHPDYKLVVAANRDEFYRRKTAAASFWDHDPDILAGRDLEASGTWLGMTRSGRISMLTNFRDLRTLKNSAPSRGLLVSNYLSGTIAPESYLQTIVPNGSAYNGFNLLVGSPDELWYYSNFGDGIQQLTKGIFGLSNHLLDTPWPKVKRGKQQFRDVLNANTLRTEMLFKLLSDEEVADDSQLPETGLPKDFERALSSMFIKTSDYGSRSSTVVLVDYDNQVSFTERVYDLETFEYTTQTFRFSAGT